MELQFIISICEVELHMIQVRQEVKFVDSESMAVGDTVFTAGCVLYVNII